MDVKISSLFGKNVITTFISILLCRERIFKRYRLYLGGKHKKGDLLLNESPF